MMEYQSFQTNTTTKLLATLSVYMATITFPMVTRYQLILLRDSSLTDKSLKFLEIHP